MSCISIFLSGDRQQRGRRRQRRGEEAGAGQEGEAGGGSGEEARIDEGGEAGGGREGEAGRDEEAGNSQVRLNNDMLVMRFSIVTKCQCDDDLNNNASHIWL